uniref:LolToxK n=1 Tax=Bichromomyia olmeca TaxID=715919 RepID=A0A1B1V3I0_9DIPT|nr:LolToxK [Bichromomyia olmeca]
MDSKLILLYFLISLIAVIYASPFNFEENHLEPRSKRDTCKQLFGWCGGDNKCCKHLYCGAFATCWWNGDIYHGGQQIAHGK